MERPLALALLVAGSCRSPAPATAPETATPTAPPAEVEYAIALRREPELSIALSLACDAAPGGETTFRIDPSWGGVEDAATLVLDLRVAGADGRELPLERARPHAWTVRAAPGERLTASWRLAQNDYQADPDPRAHYHPIVSPELFHGIGCLTLLEPEHLSGESPRRIALRWEGFREAGWAVASSFSLDPAGFEVEASLPEFRHAVFMAGAIRVHEVDVRGKPVGVAIAGSGWTFRDEDFVEDVRAIVETERAFFDDDALDFYLVTLIPVGVEDARSRSIGGTGLTQSFATFLQPGTPVGTRAGGDLSVPWLLAHEMFHHWNGRIVGRADPEALVYWFSEGFTDFFARKMMLRAGFGGIEDYERDVERKLREYHLSPAREIRNDEIGDRFFRDPDVGRIPYLRGDVVAMLLDREIRERSGGARSLDDFLRDLVERGRRGERVSTESLLERIEAWTDAAFAQRVREIVVEGRTAEIEPDTFAPCFELATEDAHAFDAGFDVEATRRDKAVRGVRAGSAAEAAGLRDGQALAGWSVALGQADVPVEMTLKEGGEDRTIRYLPRGDAVPVPQLRRVEGADCSALLGGQLSGR